MNDDQQQAFIKGIIQRILKRANYPNQPPSSRAEMFERIEGKWSLNYDADAVKTDEDYCLAIAKALARLAFPENINLFCDLLMIEIDNIFKKDKVFTVVYLSSPQRQRSITVDLQVALQPPAKTFPRDGELDT